MALRPILVALLLCLCAPLLHAQRDETHLSEAEVEQLRDSAYVPNDRVMVFIKMLDARTKSIQDLFAHPRRPGREEDTHNLFAQFTSIADELEDNLDDYGPRHRDIRKALPKLLDATERWSSALKSPPDDEAYTLSRKLALEAIRDIREDATRLVEEQRAWFATHPPGRQSTPNKDEPTAPPG
jgi:hypothetical protein